MKSTFLRKDGREHRTDAFLDTTIWNEEDGTRIFIATRRNSRRNCDERTIISIATRERTGFLSRKNFPFCGNRTKILGWKRTDETRTTSKLELLELTAIPEQLPKHSPKTTHNHATAITSRLLPLPMFRANTDICPSTPCTDTTTLRSYKVLADRCVGGQVCCVRALTTHRI